MTVAYLAKGKGLLEATCEIDNTLLKEGDVVLPVVLNNSDGQQVFTANITMYLSRKRA